MEYSIYNIVGMSGIHMIFESNNKKHVSRHFAIQCISYSFSLMN
jgi:hypothetical protein